jgi:hypothetical protein
LKPSEEEWLAAAHHGYMVQLLNLGDLSTWRQALLGETLEAMETVAQLLLTLRRVYPLELMGTSTDRTLSPLRTLQAAQLLAEIRDQPFHSNVPVIGRWIAAFRQQWNRVSTEWYVKPMIRQQSHFNTLLLTAFMQSRQEQHDLQQRAVLVLTEYLEGHSSEISELAQEIERLKRLVAELHKAPQQQRPQG